MIICKTDKKGLLEALQISPRSALSWYALYPSVDLVDLKLREEELGLCWVGDPREGNTLPEIVFVAEGQSREFTAWASVYLIQFRPFSAYSRVIEWPKYAYLIDPKPKIRASMRSAFVGVCIGESLGALNRGDIRKITPFVITSSVSFILSRNLFIGNAIDSEINVEKRLEFIRSRFASFGPVPNTINVGIIFDILEDLNRESDFDNDKGNYNEHRSVVFMACKDIEQNGSIQRTNWNRIQNIIPGLPPLDEQWKESRERRVLLFENVSQIISDSKSDKDFSAFVLAFLVSQIAPGSMNHIELLSPFEKTFPNILTWYGLCAGLYSENQVMGYRSGIGWRIARELFRTDSIFNRPSHDISFEELFMLSSSETKDGKIKIDFVLNSPNHISVELAPLVETWIPSLPPDPAETSRVSRIEPKLVSNRPASLEKASQTHLFDRENSFVQSIQLKEIWEMMIDTQRMLKKVLESESTRVTESKSKKSSRKKEISGDT